MIVRKGRTSTEIRTLKRKVSEKDIKEFWLLYMRSGFSDYCCFWKDFQLALSIHDMLGYLVVTSAFIVINYCSFRRSKL